MTTSMSPDNVDYGFKTAAVKPELEITFERKFFQRDSSGCLNIFDHARFRLDTEDPA